MGSVVAYARCVNNDGDIVGTFETDSGYGVYVLNAGLDFVNPGDDSIFIAPIEIRSWGSIDINNASVLGNAQIAGVLNTGLSFRLTVGESTVEEFPEIFAGISGRGISRINDFGVMAGTYSFEIRKKKFVNRSFRYDENENEPFELFEGSSNGTTTLNNAGDFLVWGNSTFFHEGSGFLPLDSSTLVGNATLINDWNAGSFYFIRDVTERGALSPINAPDYPAMCGNFRHPDGHMLMVKLVPISQQ